MRRPQLPCSKSVRNPGHALTDRAVNFIVKAAAERAGWLWFGY
jgi:hypothetical protein